MDTLIRMNAEEINTSFIDFIKSNFKGKNIALHVYEDEVDETEYLLKSNANKKRLFQSIENIKNDKGFKEINFSELQTILK